MSIKKAVILAAGKGERLQPFTYTKPKPLLPILDKPLLHYMIDELIKIGMIEIILVVGYLKEKIIEYVNNVFKDKVKLRFIFQKETLGTGHAVKILRSHLNEPFLLIYGDLYISHKGLRKIINEAEKYDNVLGAVTVKNPWDYGVLISKEGFLKGIIEKPKPGFEPSNKINAGIYVLSEKIFNVLDNIGFSPRGEIELTDAITALAKYKSVRIVELSGEEWFELGKLWDILELNKRMLGRITEPNINGIVENNVTVKGTIVLERNAIVKSGTYIEGPVYIGQGSVIGPHAYIRPYTVIGKFVKIGASCEIKSSIIMNYTHIPHLSYVGDSVIGEHVNFGAGTITANLRFDDKPVKVMLKGKKVSSDRRKLGAFVGDYVKTGINVSLMPGIKVGPYSWISPGLVVYDDVPPYTIVKPKDKYGYVFEKLK